MKTQFYLKSLIFLIFALLGCNNITLKIDQQVDENNVEVIDCIDLLSNLNRNTDYFLDDIVDSIKIIKLETNDNSIFGTINSIQITDKYVYIHDYNHQILIFDSYGNFVKSLEKGNGPGEISYPNCIHFNNYTKELIVHQNADIMKYSEEGNYITTIKSPYIFYNFVAYDNGYILYQASSYNTLNKTLLIITDFDFNQKKLITFGREYPISLPLFMFSKIDNYIICSRRFDNNIYYINDSSFVINYKYKLGKFEKIIEEEGGNFDIAKYDNIKDKYEIIGAYAETKNYQSFIFAKDEAYNIYRNKRTGKMITGTNYISTSTGLGCLLHYGTLFGTYNNYFIKLLYPTYLPSQDIIDKLSPNNQISQEDVEKIKNLKEDDNPLVILYTLKGLE